MEGKSLHLILCNHSLIHKSSITAYLAALVTIGVLGVDPFVQQLLTTQYRVVGVGLSAADDVHINSTKYLTPTINTAFTYDTTSIQLTTAMLADVQQDPQSNRFNPGQGKAKRTTTPQLSTANAIPNTTSKSFSSPLKATCPSGNCIFPNYYSLDICSRCQNITQATSLKNLTPRLPNLSDLISTLRHENTTISTPPGFSTVAWSLIPPRGKSVQFNTTLDVVLAGAGFSDTPNQAVYSATFMHSIVWALNVDHFLYDGGFDAVGWKGRQSYAGIDAPVVALGYAQMGFDTISGLPVLNNSMECAITYCVSEYNRSVVAGNLVSNVLSTHYGAVSGSGTPVSTFLNWSADVNGTNFTLDASVQYGSGVWTLTDFMMGQVQYDVSGDCLASDNWTCVNPPSYNPSYPSYGSEAIDLTADFAVVVENANAVVSDIIQQYGNVSIAGQNSATKPFVIVRWAWIAFPLGIVLLGMLTLGLTLWETRRLKAPAWKASLMPLIYRYGHDGGEDEHGDEGALQHQQGPLSPVQGAAAIGNTTTTATPQSQTPSKAFISDPHPQPNLVSQFEVRAEATLAYVSKAQDFALGVWMLQSKREIPKQNTWLTGLNDAMHRLTIKKAKADGGKRVRPKLPTA